jgi:hypothetical protein
VAGRFVAGRFVGGRFVGVPNVHMCERAGGKRRQWGLSKGNKNETVDSEHGDSKGRSSQPRKKSHHSN